MWDNPTPKEIEEKEFEFEAEVVIKAKGKVKAQDFDEAYDLILNREWNETTDEKEEVYIVDLRSVK